MGFGRSVKLQAWILASLMALVSVSKGIANEFDGDFHIWNEYKLTEYSEDRWTTFTWAELRFFVDASELGLWLLQQKAYASLSDQLKLGIGASYLDAKSSFGGWNSQSRLEFELNPRCRLGRDSLIALRNRIELRSLESLNYTERLVSRHRITWARSFRASQQLKRIEISEELFYDFESGQIVESRFRPANLFFSASQRSWVNVFSQIRSRRLPESGEWEHAFILGFGLRMRPWR